MTMTVFSLSHFSLWSLLLLVACGSPGLAAAPTGSDADLPREPLPEKLAPLKARSEAEQDRIAGEAWFAQGRILQQREQYAAALRCYQRAARWDPRGAAAHAEIAPLAFEL